MFSALILAIGQANAADHSAHEGGGGGKKPSSGACVKPRLERFLPPHLATVAPGSEISFAAFNVENPDQIMVTAKKQPMVIQTEFKAPFYQVTGKLPDGLRNTMARIDVMVHGKCPAEAGWLVKISE